MPGNNDNSQGTSSMPTTDTSTAQASTSSSNTPWIGKGGTIDTDKVVQGVAISLISEGIGKTLLKITQKIGEKFFPSEEQKRRQDLNRGKKQLEKYSSSCSPEVLMRYIEARQSRLTQVDDSLVQVHQTQSKICEGTNDPTQCRLDVKQHFFGEGNKALEAGHCEAAVSLARATLFAHPDFAPGQRLYEAAQECVEQEKAFRSPSSSS